MSDYLLHEISYQKTPELVFSFLKKLPWAQLLDSGSFSNQNSRYDIMVADPLVSFTVSQGTVQITHKNQPATYSKAAVFELIKQQLERKTAQIDELPFNGGALGYFGYDLFNENSRSNETTDIRAIPDLAVGIYDWTVITDHLKQKSFFFSQTDNDQSQALFRQIKAYLTTGALYDDTPLAIEKLHTDTDLTRYTKAFKRIQQYLLDGDCYQINYARCFFAKHTGSAWASYRLLRKNNPVPFGAYLNFPFAKILCASPERFLKLQDNKVETRPIKGTRPRGKNAEKDDLLKHALSDSTKDRAENLMIVDLLRNDLGKTCKIGSIKTPELFKVESYPTVHHLVSTVTGELDDGNTALDLLFPCFPGGTVTGAPKKRAMEIISELEKNRRSIYCGSIGYISYSGNMDTNIAIRTMTVNENRLNFWAGGAIVADSEVDKEFQETRDKARPFFDLLNVSE